MIGTLAGIRVIEQGTFITGPCAGMMLADLGADVIKVESPEGDPYRSLPGRTVLAALPGLQPQQAQPGTQPQGQARSRVVGRPDPRGRRLHPEFPSRHRRASRHGRPRLHELNPRLVYCSISGFGSSGPYVERPSYDSVAQALSGFLSVVVDYQRPQFLGPALADAITGLYAPTACSAHWSSAAAPAAARLVEISMLEAMTHFAVEPFAAFFALGTDADLGRSAAPGAGLHTAHGRSAPRSPSICHHWRNSGPG